MPDSMIEVLGYERQRLSSIRVTHSYGESEFLEAEAPLRAMIPGEPESEFELQPLFHPDVPEVLLGRHDFMRAFAVSFVEGAEEFSLFKR
jgi:hypothetical protein